MESGFGIIQRCLITMSRSVHRIEMGYRGMKKTTRYGVADLDVLFYVDSLFPCAHTLAPHLKSTRPRISLCGLLVTC